MKWLKKWAYLLLFLGTGVGYFACVDHWQVYAESVNRLKGWYEDLKISAEGFRSDTNGEADSVPGNEAEEESGAGGEQENTAGSGEEVSGEPGNGQENGNDPMEGQGSEPADSPSNGSGSDSGNSSAGSMEREPADNQEIASGQPGSDHAGEPEEPAAGEPVYMTVEDDYFSDALFIGDSRTVGLFEYGGLEETATFYASKGLTVYKMFDSQIVSAPGGKITVEEGLQQNTFAKIYLMIGINEMGTGTVETFLEKYKEVVDHLRELQPEAVIYVQAIIKVTDERSAKGDYINNEGIEARNQGIALLADNEKVFYLDVNPLICDESGGMNPEYTFDGVHLLGKYLEIWKDYLKSHAISS